MPMISPKISILLSSYNYAEYLPEALESLAGQNFREWELVAADDGSADASLDILRAFAERYPGQIRILTHPKKENRGLTKTLRMALEACRGEIVTFLEADDIWSSQAVSLYRTAFENCPDVVVVHGAVQMFGEQSLVRERSAQYRWQGFPPAETTGRSYEALPFLLKGNIAMTLSSIAVRKEELVSLHWNSPHDAWLDWWLLSQLAVRGKFFYEPTTIVHWRLHRKSYNVRYAASIPDEEKEARAYRTDIRRMLRMTSLNNDGKVGPDRRRLLTEALENAERSEMEPGRSLWHSFKRKLPPPVKSVLKRILFPAAFPKAS